MFKLTRLTPKVSYMDTRPDRLYAAKWLAVILSDSASVIVTTAYAGRRVVLVTRKNHWQCDTAQWDGCAGREVLKTISLPDTACVLLPAPSPKLSITATNAPAR